MTESITWYTSNNELEKAHTYVQVLEAAVTHETGFSFISLSSKKLPIENDCMSDTAYTEERL